MHVDTILTLCYHPFGILLTLIWYHFNIIWASF
jgi:hypothetical protein